MLQDKTNFYLVAVKSFISFSRPQGFQFLNDGMNIVSLLHNEQNDFILCIVSDIVTSP